MKLQIAKTFLVSLAAGLVTFFSPLSTGLYCLTTLVIVDLILAILLAVKVQKPVESRKMRKTVVKLGIYFIAVVSAYLAEVSILGHQSTIGLLSKAVLSLCSMVELRSILENLSSYSTAEGGNINFWKVLLALLQQKADQMNVKLPDDQNNQK